MKLHSIAVTVSAVLALTLTTSSAAAPSADKGPKISKCQDAHGKWHYGDTAAEACAKSKVTVLNQQGITKKEIAPPPTAADLQKLAEEQERAQQAKEQAKQDELLLSSYAHEADILYVRDRKLSQIDAQIKASEETLKSLRAALARSEANAAEEQKGGKAVSEQTRQAMEQTQAQIARHEAVIAGRKKEQDAVRARAETDLARYREIKTRRLVGKP